MSARRFLAFLFAVAIPATARAAPPAGEPLTREEEAVLAAAEAEREALIAQLLETVLRDVPPETFHGAPGRLDRPVQAIVDEMLLLDWALELTEHGGIENLDRIRATALRRRREVAPTASRVREMMSTRLEPTRAEDHEAGRGRISASRILAGRQMTPAERTEAWDRRLATLAQPRPDPPSPASPVLSRPVESSVPPVSPDARPPAPRIARIARWFLDGIRQLEPRRTIGLGAVFVAWGAFGLSAWRLLRRPNA